MESFEIEIARLQGKVDALENSMEIVQHKCISEDTCRIMREACAKTKCDEKDFVRKDSFDPEDYVTKDTFFPVRAIAYGLISIVGVSFLYAVLRLVGLGGQIVK